MALASHVMLGHTRHGFAAYRAGSHSEAARCLCIPSRCTPNLIHTPPRFNSVRVGHGEALLLVTVLACFLGGVGPFGGFGKVLPVVIALVILQVLRSGLNLLGANQHLSTAIWGLFPLAVVAIRTLVARWRPRSRKDS